jgi:hypothetical protein
MRLRIVSDGNSATTHVYTDTGHRIEGIVSVVWSCATPGPDTPAGLSIATITLKKVCVDIIGEHDPEDIVVGNERRNLPPLA